MDFITAISIAVAIIVFLLIIGNYFVYKSLVYAKKTSFKFAFIPIVLVVTAPFLLLSIPFFLIYRQIVNLILYSKYESKYWGLLEGRDAVYNLENENPVHLLFIIKYPSNSLQNFYDAAKNHIYKVLEQKAKANSKIFGAIRTYMGYSFILKNEITFDDCFRKLKATSFPLNRDDLLQLIGEYTSVPLPKNRQALWDVFVGTQPVKWTKDTENDDTKHYPILFRMNHTFADGAHILMGIIGLFADNEVKMGCGLQADKSESDQRFSMKSILNFFINIGMALIFYVRQVGITIVSPSVALVNSLLMVNDAHILHGPHPTYRKDLFLNVEETPRYVQVVKRIKKKLPGCSFEEVCLTAIAASFAEHFQKNTSRIPEFIVAEVPAVPLRLIKFEKPKDGQIFCRNRLTFAVRKLPTNVNLQKPNALIDILKTIRREGTLIRFSLEHEINYFVLSVVCHLVPAQILAPFLDMAHSCTAIISNIPGPNFITVMGGCPIQDIGAWTANRGRTGIGFAIFTYDERLQISMNVDKALTLNRNQVRSLLDEVYKYLDLLELEIMNIPDKMTI